MATKSRSKVVVAASKKVEVPLTCLVKRVLAKHQCLPTHFISKVLQDTTRKNYSQDAVSSALRKLYKRGEISRLTRGVYCVKGLV